MHDINQLLFMRRGGAVTRYHTTPPIRPQNVAEHSFGVACLLFWITKGTCTADDLMHALTHDVAEHRTGDVPATAKWASAQLAGALAEMEGQLHMENDLLFVHDVGLLKVCDMLDLCFFTLEERRRGNQDLVEIFYNGYNWLWKSYKTHAQPKDWERIIELLNWLEKEMQHAC